MTKPQIVAIDFNQAKALVPNLNPGHESFKKRIFRFDVGGPVAVCGFTFYGRTVEPWAHFLVDPARYPLVSIMMRELLDWCIAELDCKRISIPFIGDDEAKERFIRWTGCDLEAVLRCAGPHGEDLKIYARVL